MELTTDSIWNDRIKLLQPAKGYRFGLDAVLLAHFVRCTPQDHLLEIGAGNGVILVLLSHLREFDRAVAVEIQPELAYLCRRNFHINELNNAEVIEAGIQDLNLPLQSFDVLFCNPPYRKAGTGRLNPLEQKAIARHEIKMKLEDVFLCANKFLKPDGSLRLILPSFREQNLRTLAQKHNYHFHEIQYVHSQKEEPYAFVLAALGLTEQPLKQIPSLVIYDSPGVYTKEMNRLLRERR